MAAYTVIQEKYPLLACSLATPIPLPLPSRDELLAKRWVHQQLQRKNAAHGDPNREYQNSERLRELGRD